MVKVGFGNVNFFRVCFLWFMFEIFGVIGVGVIFLNLFCLSVEWYICLMYLLRYEVIVIKNCVLFVVFFCWIFILFLVLLWFVELGLGLFVYVIILLFLVLNCYLYLRIFFLVCYYKKVIWDINCNVIFN